MIHNASLEGFWHATSLLLSDDHVFSSLVVYFSTSGCVYESPGKQTFVCVCKGQRSAIASSLALHLIFCYRFITEMGVSQFTMLGTASAWLLLSPPPFLHWSVKCVHNHAIVYVTFEAWTWILMPIQASLYQQPAPQPITTCWKYKWTCQQQKMKDTLQQM